MINEELRQKIAENYPDAIILDNPSFDKSIIGISTDERIVYDLQKMAEELAEEDDIDIVEAIEFIEYNTMRAVPYMGDMRPILVDPTIGFFI